MALGILLLIAALTNADLTGITPATQEEIGLSEVMVQPLATTAWDPGSSSIHIRVGGKFCYFTN